MHRPWAGRESWVYSGDTERSEEVVHCEVGQLGTWLGGHCEDFGFYSGFSRKTLKDFKQGS